MVRVFTKDAGRYKKGTISGDWPPMTWRQIEKTMGQKMDKFSTQIAPGLTLGVDPLERKAPRVSG